MPGILGVDPGLGGALAIFDGSKTPASGLRWVVEDVPLVGDEKRRELNAAALRDWLRRYSPDHAFVELVSAMPSIPGPNGVRRGMGATSAFRFGGVFYALKAVLACCDVPYEMITPQSWKKSFGMKGPDKERSRLKAVQLFPDAQRFLARKKDQNRAEAMLIAQCGYQIRHHGVGAR